MGRDRRRDIPTEDGLDDRRQRLDQWLWFARVVKSRSLATRLVQDGHVRIGGTRCLSAARPVGPGHVLTIALDRQVRVLRVVAIADRRGPFPEARRLYDDLGGDPPPGEALALPA